MPLPRAKKSFSQNFLTDRSVVKKIIIAADIKPGETVLEIGPGTGVLTEALIAAGAKVTAVEADRDMVTILETKFGDAINLIFGDILTVGARRAVPLRHDLRDHRYKLVANIPYSITSAILQTFLRNEPRPSRMVLMVQREVAERIVAAPPGMSLLSVVCQMYADVSRVAVVPRGAFSPMPKVDSAVVRLDLVASPRCSDPEGVIILAKAGFAARRKQLHGNLAKALKRPSGQIKQALEAIGQNPQARAENLTLQDWISLAKRLGKLK